MARLRDEGNGRFAVIDEVGSVERVIGYGRLEIPYLPEGAAGTVQTDVKFVLEAEDTIRDQRDQLMVEANRHHV